MFSRWLQYPLLAQNYQNYIFHPVNSVYDGTDVKLHTTPKYKTSMKTCGSVVGWLLNIPGTC